MARRFLGVDYGEVRIGLAVADEDLKVARPLSIIGSNLEDLREVIMAEAITDIVLGLPRSLEGTDTAQTELVRQFAAELEVLGLPIVLQDEAATTDLARQTSDQRLIDDQAAAIILQDFLETQ